MSEKGDDIVVWDIGGGSFQISSREKNGKLNVYAGTELQLFSTFSRATGSYGTSNSLKLLVEEVRHQKMVDVPSPNPVTEDHALQYDSMIHS